MKKILIISSEYTGHGHKSVDTALLQYFKLKYKDKIEKAMVTDKWDCECVEAMTMALDNIKDALKIESMLEKDGDLMNLFLQEGEGDK